jgi:hypothetical protein
MATPRGIVRRAPRAALTLTVALTEAIVPALTPPQAGCYTPPRLVHITGTSTGLVGVRRA